MFTAILTIAQCETTVTAHDVKFFISSHTSYSSWDACDMNTPVLTAFMPRGSNLKEDS